LNNTEFEGSLSVTWKWVKNEIDKLCTLGIRTLDENNNPFNTDNDCERNKVLKLSWLNRFRLKEIQGINIDDIRLGEQIITYECEGNPSCNTSESDITYGTIYNVK